MIVCYLLAGWWGGLDPLAISHSCVNDNCSHLHRQLKTGISLVNQNFERKKTPAVLGFYQSLDLFRVRKKTPAVPGFSLFLKFTQERCLQLACLLGQ